MVEADGMRVLARLRLGLMDIVKVAFGSRGMTVEAARQCAIDRKELRDLVQMLIIFISVFFRTTLITWRGVRCRYMMRVGINCKKNATTDIKVEVSSILANGCILDGCAC